jgi:NAD-dependent dihydropyrimidine dehydrogenase PreA subunit
MKSVRYKIYSVRNIEQFSFWGSNQRLGRSEGSARPRRGDNAAPNWLFVDVMTCKLAEGTAMTYVITEPCIGTKDASCVEVCPVDCIHSNDAAEQFFINPEECIDCGACVSTCPVQAICAEEEVPPRQERFIAVNAEFFAD